jgi:hypothetical protein
MSYQSQWTLTYDDAFVGRCRASLVQRADIYKDDERPEFVALAESLLKEDNPQETLTFVSLLANAPGFAAKVDNGDGTVDSSQIEDAEIQSAVDFQWPVVSALFYPAP